MGLLSEKDIVAERKDEKPPETPKSVVLDGDDIPEAFRGKPAKEVIDQILSTSTELETLKRQLAERDAYWQAELEKAKKSTAPPSQPTEEEIRQAKEREFLADPIKFLEKHHAERTAPIVNQYLEDQSHIQREFAKQRIGVKEFTRLEKRIDELIKAVPLEARARPETWDVAYTVALGEEYRKKLSEESAKAGLHIEGEGTPSPEKVKKPQLSDEERNVASKFGMTEEEYLKWKETYSV